MLNVCFGDSECGLLKHALFGESVTFSYRLLNLGEISANDFENGRRKWIDAFFDICSKKEREKIYKEELLRFEKIIEAARTEKKIRIWYASAPFSMCGFYHLVYSCQNIDCKIFVVEMPKSIGYNKSSCDKCWAEVEPFEVRDCLKLERELSTEERTEIAKAWEKLAKENAELRLNINGNITSVPIDYLDEEIMSYAPRDKEFSLGFLVGSTIGKSTHSISDAFISSRIEAMIDKCLLTIVGKRPKNRMDYYSKTYIKVAR